MPKQNRRGSTKVAERLFSSSALSPKELTEAIKTARANFFIERWWWYGQPAIDLIRFTVNTPAANSGRLIQDIVKLHGNAVQVNLDVFPYGIINPDGVRINVSLERKVGGPQG